MAKAVAEMSAKINIDSKQAIEDAKQIFQNMQEIADKEKIVYKVSGDEDSLREQIKKIEALDPNVRANIELTFDTGDLQKQLKQAESLAGKSASQIATNIRDSIKSGLNKPFNLDKLVQGKEAGLSGVEGAKENARFNKSNAKNLIFALEKQLADFNKESAKSEEDIYNQIKAVKALEQAKLAAGKAGYIDETIDAKKLAATSKTLVNELVDVGSDNIAKNLENWTNTIREQFTASQELVKRISASAGESLITGTTGTGTGSGTGTGTGTGDISAEQYAIEAEKVKELENRIEELTNKETEAQSSVESLTADLDKQTEKTKELADELKKYAIQIEEINSTKNAKIVPSEYIQNLTDDIDKLTSKLTKAKREVDYHKRQKDNLAKQKQQISNGEVVSIDEFERANGIIDYLTDDTNALSATIRELEEQIIQTTNKMSQMINIADMTEADKILEAQVEERKKNIVSLEQEAKAHSEKITKQTEELNIIEKAIAENRILQTTEEKRLNSIAERYSAVVREMKTYKDLIADTVKTTEKKYSGYLDAKKVAETTGSDADKKKADALLKSAANFYKKAQEKGYTGGIMSPTGEDVSPHLTTITQELDQKYKRVQDDAVTKLNATNKKIRDLTLEKNELENELEKNRQQYEEYTTQLATANKKGITLDEAKKNREELAKAKVESNKELKVLKDNIEKAKVESKKVEEQSSSTLDKVKAAMSKVTVKASETAKNAPTKIIPTAKKVEKTKKTDLSANELVDDVNADYYVEAIVVPKIHPQFKAKVTELLSKEKLKATVEITSEDIEKTVSSLEVEQNKVKEVIEEFKLLNETIDFSSSSISQHKLSMTQSMEKESALIKEVVQNVDLLNKSLSLIKPITFAIEGLENIGKIQETINGSNISTAVNQLSAFAVTINNLGASLNGTGIVDSLSKLKNSLNKLSTIDLSSIKTLKIKQDAFSGLSSLNATDIENFDKFVRVIRKARVLESLAQLSQTLQTADFSKLSTMSFKKGAFDALNDISIESIVKVEELAKSLEGFNNVNPINTNLLKGITLDEAKANKIGNTANNIIDLSYSLETLAGVNKSIDSIRDLTTELAKLKGVVNNINDIKVTYTVNEAGDIKSTKVTDGKKEAVNQEKQLNDYYKKSIANINEIITLTEKIGKGTNRYANEAKLVKALETERNLQKELNSLGREGVDVSKTLSDIDEYRSGAELDVSGAKKELLNKKKLAFDDRYKKTTTILPEDFTTAESIATVKTEIEKLKVKADEVNEDNIADLNTINKELDTQLRLLRELTLESNKIYAKGKGSLLSKPDSDTTGEKPNGIVKEQFELNPASFGTEAISRQRKEIQAFLEQFEEGKVILGNFSNDYSKMAYTVKTKNNMIKNMSLEFDAIEGSTRKVMVSEKEWTTVGEKLAKSFKTKFVNMLQYISGMDILLGLMSALREGVASIKELDAAMISLAKVSDASNESMLKFKNNAHEIAQSISSTTTAVIEAAAEWSRLGYSIKQVEELSKTTAVYVNVGGGLDAQTATQDIVSAMKAFNIEAENSMSVVDKMNEVGNNYAASSEQLGEILQKSSSTLAVSGDSLDQVIAMGAAMNTIVQDASTTGSTLKVLSLRLRGAKTELTDAGEETDSMAESTSKLREKVMALTNVTGKGGFDIMVNDKEFKTTYDIMKGISAEWSKMSNIDQAALLELIAGKNRAQGAAALINSFSIAEQALQSSLNSQGSALKENETYMKGIEGQLGVLKSKWQEIWDNEETRKAIVLVIKIGQAILDVIEKVGLFKSVLGAIFVGGGIYGGISIFITALKTITQAMGGLPLAGNLLAETFKLIGSEAKDLGTILKTMGQEGFGNIKKTVMDLFSLFMKLPIQIKLVVAALAALVAVYAAFKGAEYKQKKDLEESLNAYTESTDKIQEYTKELETTRKTIKELQSMGVLTLTQASELENLKAQNAELEYKLALENAIADAALEKTVKKEADNYDDYKKDYKKDKDVDFDLGDLQERLKTVNAIKEGYVLGNYQLEYRNLKIDFQDEKEEALKQAQDIQEKIDRADKHIAAGNTLTGDEQEAYNTMKQDVEDIYSLFLTNSEKLVMQIQPVFDKQEFTGKYDEMMSYFLAGGSTDTKALRKKFGDDLIDALEGAAKDAGMTLPEVISSMYDNAMNAENTFAPIISTPSGKEDVAQNQSSAEKRKWFETLSETEQAPIISGELQLSVDDSLDDCKAKLHEFVTGAEETEISLTFTASLDKTKTDFETLSKAYGESTTGTKQVNIDSLNALSESFGNLDGYSEFINTLTNVNSTAEETQTAFNELATTYLDQSGLLDTLTQENTDYTVSQLKLMGVTNATDVVEGKLAEKYGVESQAKKELLATSQALNNTKYTEANANNILASSSQGRLLEMINEGNAAGQTTVALQKLLYEKIRAKGFTLTTDGDIKNLIALAKATGGSTAALIKYAQVKAAIARMGTYTGSGTADTAMLAELERQIKSEITAMLNYAGGASNSGGGGVTYTPSTTSSSGGGGGSSDSSATTVTPELYDWIEVAITRLEETITRLGKTVSNVYTTWIKRNKALGDELSTTRQELATQQEALNIYSSIANGVTLSEDYKAKIRNGQMTVDSVSDEETKTQIANYQKWYGLVVTTKTAIDDLTISLSELSKQKFDNIGSEFEQLISLTENQQSQLDKAMDIVTAQGHKISESYYKSLISIEQNKQNQLKNELSSLQNSLSESVNSGAIEQGSEAWIEMQNKINDVNLAIQDSTLSIINFNNEIRQLKWDAFDEMQDSIALVTEESNFLIDLLSNDKLFSKGGDMTDAGQTTLGLHAQNYNTYMLQSQKYASELKKIQAELAADPSNQTLIARERELIKAQRDVISSAEDEKQAMIDLEAQGIQLQIDAMQELIDKKKESLDAEQSLYEYQKSIAEKTKAIAALQKQQTALSGKGANTEENRAKIQSIKLQLEEAKTDLADTERQKALDDEKKMLDTFMTEYSDLMNAKLDDVQVLIKELIDRVNNNASTIANTIENSAKESGYTLTEELKNIWSSGSIGNVVGVFTNTFTGYSSSVISILSKIATSVTGEETPEMGKIILEAYDKTSKATDKYMAQGDSAILKLFENKSFNPAVGVMSGMESTLNNMVSSSMESLGSSTKTGDTSIQNDVTIVLDLPNATDYNSLVTQLQRDTRFENIVKAMTVDQLSGKNSLSKLKY